MAFDRRKRSGGKREDSRRDGGKGRMSGRRGDASGKMSRKDNEKPLKECPDYTGTVQMTRDGFVFVKVEGMEDDIFVRNGKTKGALNGDTVKVAVTKEEIRHVSICKLHLKSDSVLN